jgi:hypothetical protein
LQSSEASLRSDGRAAVRELILVILFLTVVVAAAGYWCFRGGYILYYGDAQAHLNISRGLMDSKTPGYDQIGTVWLPVLHVICLPLVQNDFLWSSGLAGTIPVAVCFIIAATTLYLAARNAYGSILPAAIVLACFVLNPNVLYLATIPMTEIVFLAGLALLLLAELRYSRNTRTRWFAIGIICCWFISLTRYDGWFLIPFAAAWFAISSPQRRVLCFILFMLLAGLAPAYWLAHNWYESGSALYFYNGPYSAVAIQGRPDYPGYQSWRLALLYYGSAAQLCAGWSLIWLGLLGVLSAAAHRVLKPALFLSLTPLFYLWSMHSTGGTPIHVPNLWPHSYYNTRYGIAVVALSAFAAGAIPLAMPLRFRKYALLVPLLAVVPWVSHPSRENVITWKESQVNSDSRRVWTAESAAFLAAHYQSRQGILSSAGDVPGIYCKAKIHLSETLNIGNGPAWIAATARPDLFHPNAWAIAQQADLLSKALEHSPVPVYKVTREIRTKDDPVLRILTRENP